MSMTEEEIQQMYQELEKGGVKFLPWIGGKYEKGIYYDEKGELRYGNGKGKKVLVLGESFYWDDDDDGNGKMFIHDLIKNLVNPKFEFQPYKRTFIKFERAMTGKPWEKEEETKRRIEFWEHIMFYNYVQEPLRGTRFSPTNEQYEKAKNAFFTLLKFLEPDYIIVWGMRLYNNLPQEGEQGPDLEIDNDIYETWMYKVETKKIPFMAIYHPSVGFDWSYWNKLIVEFNKLLYDEQSKKK